MVGVLFLGRHQLTSQRARAMSWVLGVALGVFFLAAAVPKLVGLEFEREMFAAWGYPVWFMYAVGAAELAFALLVIVPATRFWGTFLICGEMVGAAFTHVKAGEFTALFMPVAALLVAFWLAWLERPAFDQLGGPERRISRA